MEDVKNNVSQELMAEHTSAYGNARITYRIYKNHPAGKVTTLDRIVTTNFRCEEKTTSRNGLSCPIPPLS